MPRYLIDAVQGAGDAEKSLEVRHAALSQILHARRHDTRDLRESA
jgi:hypothetical protein